MPGRGRDPLTPHELGIEGQSVLAVLTLAALWPSRFPGGWVGVDDFARLGTLLGERADRESLKAAVRRGLQQVGELPHPARLEVRRARKAGTLGVRPPRELDRRLSSPPPSTHVRWLFEDGLTLVAYEYRRSYLSSAKDSGTVPPAAALAAVRQLLREADNCLGSV